MELHIALDIPERVRERIGNYAATLGLPSSALVNPAEYHITVAFADEGLDKVDHHEIRNNFNMQGLKFEAKGLRRFEHDAVVIELDNPYFNRWADKLNDWLRDKGVKPETYPGGYKPHITIAYTKDEPTQRPLPPLVFRGGPISISTPRNAPEQPLGPLTASWTELRKQAQAIHAQRRKVCAYCKEGTLDVKGICTKCGKSQGVEKEAMAVTPRWWQEFIKEYPYVYHGARANRHEGITTHGLLPADHELGKMNEMWSNAGLSRPGHVYFSLDDPLDKGYGGEAPEGRYVYKVPTHTLAPENINPDEDDMDNMGFGGPRIGDNESWGDYAERVGWGDNPQDTEEAIPQGERTLAYRGVIPPEHVEIHRHYPTPLYSWAEKEKQLNEALSHTAQNAVGETFYHVAPASARESIMQHGLDATRGATPWGDLNAERTGFPVGNFMWDHPNAAKQYLQSMGTNAIAKGPTKMESMHPDEFLDYGITANENGEVFVNPSMMGETNEDDPEPEDQDSDAWYEWDERRHDNWRPYTPEDKNILPPHLQGFDIWEVRPSHEHQVHLDPEPTWEFFGPGGRQKQHDPEKIMPGDWQPWHDEDEWDEDYGWQGDTSPQRYYTPQPIAPQHLKLHDHVPLAPIAAGAHGTGPWTIDDVLENSYEYEVPEPYTRMPSYEDYQRQVAEWRDRISSAHEQTEERLSRLTELVATLANKPEPTHNPPERRRLIVKRDENGRISSIEEAT